MILYLDSSSIASTHLLEPNRHDRVLLAVDEADAIATCIVAYPEVRFAIARARFKENPPRLSAAGYRRALGDLQADWHTYYSIAISEELVFQAGQLADKHRLRAYDAIHLAALMALNLRTAELVEVSTWDRELGLAVRAEGFSLAHEALP